VKEKGLNSDLLQISLPQQHIFHDGKFRPRKASKYDLGQAKRNVQQHLEHLDSMTEWEEKRKYIREELFGSMDDVIRVGGIFDDKEADHIVDIIIRSHEIKGKHPLQTAIRRGRRPRFRNDKDRADTIQSSSLFYKPSLKGALGRRGFYMNFQIFSESESLTLMKNFECFLKSHGRSTYKDALSTMFQTKEFC
jgi:hypothetical protein